MSVLTAIRNAAIKSLATKFYISICTTYERAYCAKNKLIK